MKKAILLITALSMIFMFASCGSQPTFSEQTDTKPQPTEQPTPEPTIDPTPVPTEEPTPTPVPTPEPLTSRADLIGIGFENPEGNSDIFVCPVSKLFDQPLIASFMGDDVIDPAQGFMIDYANGRIAIGSNAYEMPEEYMYEYGTIVDENGNMVYVGEGEMDGQTVELSLSPYMISEDGTVFMDNFNDLCFNAERLECINVDLNMRMWNVFQFDIKDDIGYDWVNGSSAVKDSIIDEYAMLHLYELAEQNAQGMWRVNVTPDELRTEYGLAGLDEDYDQQILEAAYAQYENVVAIIEETLGITVADLHALQ